LTQLAPVASDALLSSKWLVQGAAAYLDGLPATDPRVSPIFADLAGLPPTLIQSASEEVLRDDSRRLAAALAVAGVQVSHREHSRMWHDFQLYAGLVPEATQAVSDIAAFAGAQLRPVIAASLEVRAASILSAA
jgi:epsilon-lactone hydrolase